MTPDEVAALRDEIAYRRNGALMNAAELAILAELDAMLLEPVANAEDLGAELLLLQAEFRDARQTERPQAWNEED